jgi:hypothetical protein
LLIGFAVKQKMRNILKNRLALSTVVTTLIILVVSVLLAGVVTYFAINVTSTRVQEESLSLEMLHVWCPQSASAITGQYPAEAAFVIINTGGRDVVINKITIRGQEAPWAQVYSGVGSVTADLAYVPGTDATTHNAEAILATAGTVTGITMTAASGDITLKSGDSMVVYVVGPDSITINDIGLTVGITVFTSQAMYYQEANVQAYVPAA